MKNRLIAGVFVALAALAVAVPAAADNKKGNPLTLNCATLGIVNITTNDAGGTWTPGQVTAGNMVLNPYELHISGVYTPDEGAPFPFTEDNVKNAPRNGRLDVCTFSQTFTDGYGTGTFGGTVLLSYTKR